jgi:hypothetical protein
LILGLAGGYSRGFVAAGLRRRVDARRYKAMRRIRGFGILLAIVAISLAVPASSLGSTQRAPRLPSSATDWATFTPSERAAALAYERTRFEAALAAGTLEWTSGSASPTAVNSDEMSVEAVTSVDARCGLSWTFTGSGTWTYGYAWVDTSFPAYHIYAGEPPVATMNQFIRSGTILEYFYKYSVGAGSSYEYAQSGSNFKWFFENINYRTKSWMGVQRYKNGSWQLGPDAYCTYTANP